MRFKKAASDKKFFYRTLISAIAVMAVIMLILTLIFYYILNSAVIKNIKNTEKGIADNTSSHAYDYFDQLAYISNYFLLFNQNVSIDNINPETSFWLKKSISDSIDSYASSHDYINNIYVKIKNYEFSRSPLDPVSDEIIETFVYNNISHSKNPSWPYDLYFSNIRNGTPAYNDVIIQVSTLKLSEKIFSNDSYRKEYLIDKSGTVIASSDSMYLNENLCEKYKFKTKNLSDNFFSINKSGEKYYCTVSNVKKTSLKIVSFAPESVYSDLINASLSEILLIGFSMQIISFFCCYFTVSKIYSPIKKINETFKYHFPEESGEFESEIEYINNNIEKTIRSNENLERELPQALKKLHSFQVEALQSQINPHFLYNTLDNIKSISVDLLDIDNPIENSLLLLNNILAESMDRTSIIITLSREAALTESYIELMKLRYRNNFDVDWSIESGLESYAVLKLLIQPMIENSIIHGFSNVGTNQKISIMIYSENDDMIIKVKDNGRGIESQRLSEIKNCLSDPDTETTNKHIGLINIQLRLRLLYGSHYGLSIDSTEAGTECTVRFPKSSIS